MSSTFRRQLRKELSTWWREQRRNRNFAGASVLLLKNLWSFARESTPERRRRRYGDMEYDWEHRVNTTSGTVDWRSRLLGSFLSPYQPTEPELFQEMMAALPLEFERFTFVDLGSGKGRTLLMASEHPFRRIIGVELIADLHAAAEQNIRAYRSPTQKCARIECVLADARHFELPPEALVLYLFNPLPEQALAAVLSELEKSLAQSPRPVWIVDHNPASEQLLSGSAKWKKISGMPQYSIYSTAIAVQTF